MIDYSEDYIIEKTVFLKKREKQRKIKNAPLTYRRLGAFEITDIDGFELL